MDIRTYARKPFEVQAVRVTDENMRQVAAWCDSKIHTDNSTERIGNPYIKVVAQNQRNDRQGRAYIGDWVTETRTGFKAYTDGAFQRTFDLVKETDSENALLIETDGGVLKFPVDGGLPTPMDERLAEVTDEASLSGSLPIVNLRTI